MPFRFSYNREIYDFVSGGTPTKLMASRALISARSVIEDRLNPIEAEAVWIELGLNLPGNPLTVQARLGDIFAPPPIEFVRSFYQHSRSHYRYATPLRDRITDNIMVKVTGRGEDGIAVDGEFAIEWVDLSGEPSARIQTYNDGLAAMNCCQTLLYAIELAIERLRGSPNPDEVRSILERLGYKDCTAVSRENMHDDEPIGPGFQVS